MNSLIFVILDGNVSKIVKAFKEIADTGVIKIWYRANMQLYECSQVGVFKLQRNFNNKQSSIPEKT